MEIEETTVEQTQEEVLFELASAIHKSPLHREILLRILNTCAELKTMGALEKEVASWPEFATAVHDQAWLIERMVEHKGLVRLYLGFDGNTYTQEYVDALSEDDLFEQIEDEAFLTTEAGRMVAEEYSPRTRLTKLLKKVPARMETYLEILDYVKGAPRQYAELYNMLKDNPILVLDAHYQDKMQPSVFIDKLEQSGVIQWSDGWKLSQEGCEILAEVKQSLASQMTE